MGRGRKRREEAIGGGKAVGKGGSNGEREMTNGGAREEGRKRSREREGHFKGGT